MILIGTWHYDLEGPKRLEHLLKSLSPKRVTIESPSNLPNDAIVEKIMAVREFYTQLSLAANLPPFFKDWMVEISQNLSYEIVLPVQYGRKAGIEVYPVDSPLFANILDDLEHKVNKQAYIDYLEKTAGDLAATLRAEGIDALRFEYALWRQAVVQSGDNFYYNPDRLGALLDQDIGLLPNVKLVNELLKENPEERERILTAGVMARNPDVHISGLAHVFEEHEKDLGVTPLYKRLGEFVSRRIRLCDAFKIQSNQ